jgi:sulfite reductase beta subunit-like hemoprotein
MDACTAPVHDRTDRCPGVLQLHDAADGRLARVRLPGGRIAARGLAAVAEVAALGNGIVELTSRASLQVRGLSAGDGERCAELLSAGGLLSSVAHDRVRNILASPVAGRHARSIAATDAVVDALDRGLCADLRLAALPGRFLFAVDDGSGLAYPSRADVALVAEAPSASLRLWLGGSPTTICAAPARAAGCALDAARAFLDLLAESGDGAWRIADVDDGPALVARRLAGELATTGELRSMSNSERYAPTIRHDRTAAVAVGRLAQVVGGTAITVLPALGRLDREVVARLASLVGEVRLSTARTLTVVDVLDSDVAPLIAQLSGLGLVTASGSGWPGLSACAGLGACTRALVDVRAAAGSRAASRSGGSPPEHWSACERGCGRPAGAPVSVVATADGVRVETDGDVAVAGDVEGALALLGAGA